MFAEEVKTLEDEECAKHFAHWYTIGRELLLALARSTSHNAEVEKQLLGDPTFYLAFVKPKTMTEADGARLRSHFADLLAEWFGAHQEARELVA